MTDLHTRLRTELFRLDMSTGGCGNMLGAIEAVVDLHTPGPFEEWPRVRCCNECADADAMLLVEWPCPTVVAIAEALGVTEEPTADQELIEEEHRG